MEKKLLKIDRNGTKHWEITSICPDCNGTGVWRSYYNNGYACRKCGGSGTISKIEKEYTPEYAAKLQAKAEIKQQAKDNAIKAQVPENNLKFLKNHGFNENGIAYAVLGDTYQIKDKIKNEYNGQWISNLKHWIIPKNVESLNTYEISVDDIYAKDNYGAYQWNSFVPTCYDLADELKAKDNEILDKSLESIRNSSQFQGYPGMKLEIEIEPNSFKEANIYHGAYGDTYFYKFKDKNGNIFTWGSSNNFSDLDKIKKVVGTVKDFNEYKGICQTVLTRCKLYTE